MTRLNTEWGQHFLFPEVDFGEPGSIPWNIAVHAATLDNASNRDPLPLTPLTMVRSMIANMVVHAAESGEFGNYTQDFGWGKASESDRITSLRWLQWYASTTGLLHANEILWLSQFLFGRVPAYLNDLGGGGAPESREDLDKNIEVWLDQGYEIAAFQGTFDHPTATHLKNATFAHLWAQDNVRKIKLVWWFDNDRLAKRKGIERPRYPLDLRRSSVGGLWQVAATAVSTAVSTDDRDAYIADYRDTGTTIVFVTEDEPLSGGRIATATRAGAEIVTLPVGDINFHSSEKVWRL